LRVDEPSGGKQRDDESRAEEKGDEVVKNAVRLHV
jgi:hypothetical protein